MVEPVLTQAEADGLIAVRKTAPFESQFYAAIDTRSSLGKPKEIQVVADAPFEGAALAFRILHAPRVNALALSLIVQLPGRAKQFVARYDMHNNPHPNKPRCGGVSEIPPGLFHVHRYREALIRIGYDWDDCADVLTVPGGLQAGSGRLLAGAFVADMSLGFEDHTKYDDLFRMGDP